MWLSAGAFVQEKASALSNFQLLWWLRGKVGS